MILVYLIRHAESTGNAENRLGGRTDYPLTDLGRLQAERAARTIVGGDVSYPLGKLASAAPFTAVYTSPLRRARDTAQALVQRLRAGQSEPFDFVVDERINEIDTGELDGKTFLDGLGEHEETVRGIPYHPEQPFPGGESHGDVIARTGDFVKELSERHAVPDANEVSPYGEASIRERIAIFSHGITVNYLMHHLLGIPAEGVHRFPVGNATISVVELARGFPRLLVYDYAPTPTE
jgi:broad specificity phosphatase PhoE